VSLVIDNPALTDEAARRAKRREQYRARRQKEHEERARKRASTKPPALEERFATSRSGHVLLAGKAWKTTGVGAKCADHPPHAKVLVLTLYAFPVFHAVYQQKEERKFVLAVKRHRLVRYVYPRDEVPDPQQALTALADAEMLFKQQRKWKWVKGDWPQAGNAWK
jgi:hypothetical protein